MSNIFETFRVSENKGDAWNRENRESSVYNSDGVGDREGIKTLDKGDDAKK